MTEFILTQQPATQKLMAETYYSLTAKLAKELREINLHASEWRLWSYLVTLDPFGDRYLEMPDLVDILTECNISKATFYRALAKFEEHQLFDTQPLKIAFRNLRGAKNSLTHETPGSPMSPKVSPMSPKDSPMSLEDSPMRLFTDEEVLKPLQVADCEKEPNVPITDQTCLTNNKTGDPVINREGTGTDALLSEIEKAGINPNKTIRKTILQIQSQNSAALSGEIVRNALTAVLEQAQSGTVRNIGGLLNAALQRGFTANQAKIEAREKRSQSEAVEEPRRAPIEREISSQIDTCLMSDHRDWAIHKLQSLWNEGWNDFVEELLYLRRDWGFRITSAGVQEVEHG